MIFNLLGQSNLVEGPKRIILGRDSRVQFLQKVIASATEYLVLTRQDGTKEHRQGPCAIFFNPVEFKNIETKPIVSIPSQYAAVLYNEDKLGKVTRNVIYGPRAIVPEANQWLGQFSWHGEVPAGKAGNTAAKGTNIRPMASTCSLLNLRERSMAVKVKDVRTKDDCNISILVIMHFVIRDVERMLRTTRDPIGDLVNAVCSDVISIVATQTFSEFIAQSHLLNNVDTYKTVVNRAPFIGFNVSTLDYQGYEGNAAMEKMHEAAITQRTRQRLNTEKAQLDLKVKDLKLKENEELGKKRASLAKLKKEGEMSVMMIDKEAEISTNAVLQEKARAIDTAMHEAEISRLNRLKELNVDLSRYLVAQRAVTVDEHTKNLPVTAT